MMATIKTTRSFIVVLRTDHPVLAFLAKQGDNGVVWHILTYWRPTE